MSTTNLIAIRLCKAELTFVGANEQTAFYKNVSRWLETFNDDLVIVLNSAESNLSLLNDDVGDDEFCGISWNRLETEILRRINDELMRRLGLSNLSSFDSPRLEAGIWDAYEHEAAIELNYKSSNVTIQASLVPELLKLDPVPRV